MKALVANSLNATSTMSLFKKAVQAPFTVPSPVRTVLFVLIELPLLYLYLQGPQFAGIGFWEGQPFHAICHQLTKVDADHWQENMDVCEQVIERKFYAVLVAVYCVLYIICVIVVVRFGCRGLARVFGLLKRVSRDWLA
jgi:hypothetical protein